MGQKGPVCKTKMHRHLKGSNSVLINQSINQSIKESISHCIGLSQAAVLCVTDVSRCQRHASQSQTTQRVLWSWRWSFWTSVISKLEKMLCKYSVPCFYLRNIPVTTNPRNFTTVNTFKQFSLFHRAFQFTIYRMSGEECARLMEGVPYVKVYRYNPKPLCPKLNSYGDNCQRILKHWQLLHTYWLPNTH
jgi:hypothetical protein